MKYVLFGSFIAFALSLLACHNAGVKSGDHPAVDQYGAHGSFEPLTAYSAEDTQKPFYKSFYKDGCTTHGKQESKQSFDRRVAVGMEYTHLSSALTTSANADITTSFTKRITIDTATGTSWHGKGIVTESNYSHLAEQTEFQVQCSELSSGTDKNPFTGEVKTLDPVVSCSLGNVEVSATPAPLPTPGTTANNSSSPGPTPTTTMLSSSSYSHVTDSLSGTSCAPKFNETPNSQDAQQHYVELHQDGNYRFAGSKKPIKARRIVSIQQNVPMVCGGGYDVGTGTIVSVLITSYDVPSLEPNRCGGIVIFKRSFATTAKGKLMASQVSELLSFKR